MSAAIAVIWGVIEPLWALIQLTLHLGSKNYLKVPKDQISHIVSEAFDDFVGYICEYGLQKEKFAPQKKSIYVSATIARLKYSNSTYSYVDGQLEYFFSQRFSLTKENNFDKFLLNSYLLIRLKAYKKFSFPKERFKALLMKKKKTIFHYLTIPNWRSKKSVVLLEEVKQIKKTTTIWLEDYKFSDLWNYALKNEDSSLKVVLDDVLKSGQISQSAILNMASAEKLLIIHKYSEGYGTVRQKQLDELERLKEIITRNTGRTSRISQNRLEQAKSDKQNLLDNWIRVPVGAILEEKGFRHLFSKNDPIYFIPVSILPNIYHNTPKKYIDEVILPDANKLLENSKNSPFLEDFEGGLKYVMVAHVVQVNELTILESERTLSSIGPSVSEALLTSTLDNDGSYINNLFINDVVRNVDFMQYLKPGKTTNYLKSNFQNLKTILYNKFNIDIYKPAQLVQLTAQNIDEIAADLLIIDSEAKKYLLVRLITEKVEFYRKLDVELRGLKTG